MASKDSSVEYVIRAVDEFSKAMKDFQNYLKHTSENSAKTEKSVKALGDRLTGFGNIMTGFLRQVGADAFEFLKNGLESLISLIPQAYDAGYQYIEMIQMLQNETGMTAKEVSTYAAVMRTMGVETNDMAIIFARFGKNIGSSEEKFKDLGHRHARLERPAPERRPDHREHPAARRGNGPVLPLDCGRTGSSSGARATRCWSS